MSQLHQDGLGAKESSYGWVIVTLAGLYMGVGSGSLGSIALLSGILNLLILFFLLHPRYRNMPLGNPAIATT